MLNFIRVIKCEIVKHMHFIYIRTMWKCISVLINNKKIQRHVSETSKKTVLRTMSEDP